MQEIFATALVIWSIFAPMLLMMSGVSPNSTGQRVLLGFAFGPIAWILFFISKVTILLWTLAGEIGKDNQSDGQSHKT